MNFRARSGSPSAARFLLIVLALAAAICPACLLRKKAEKQPPTEAAAQASQDAAQASPQATPGPSTVTVHIGYARRGDYLEALSVDKFASATLIPAHEEKSGVALVRFEGGEPVWSIAADRGVSGSLLGHVPGVDENRKFAVTEVTYGVVPRNFAKEQPENSDPEPLETGKYYVFTVRRASGSVDYQAVHVADDGTIEDYEAQPRVGTSYALCCNVAADFASAGADTSVQP